MKKWFQNLIPDYARIPLLIVLIYNFVVYYGTKLLTLSITHHDVATAIDESIPFIPFFIIFYVLAYPQWITSYILAGRENKKLCYRVVAANLIAKTISFIILVAYPSTMQRPELTGKEGLFEWMTAFIYACDTPYNLFPSLHCLESWMCIRAAFRMKKVPGWYKWFSLCLSVLIFASTVLVKQHAFWDIWAGIGIMELSIWISRLLKSERIFEKVRIRVGHH